MTRLDLQEGQRVELKRQWADSALKDLAAFANDPSTPERLEAMGLNDRQVQAVLYVKEHGKLTNREYRELSSISDEEARLDLNRLVGKGLLEVRGKGRNTHYVLGRVGD